MPSSVRQSEEVVLMNSPATKLTLSWEFPVSRPKVPLSPRMREGVWTFASYRDRRRLCLRTVPALVVSVFRSRTAGQASSGHPLPEEAGFLFWR